MHKGVDAYYDRKIEVQRDVVSAAMARRDEFWPQADINEITEDTRELALAPWIFQSLPGTKPAQQWPTSLPALVERLDQLEPYQLWSEPLDLLSGGPEFFAQAKHYISTNLESLVNGYHVKNPHLIEDTAFAMLCHFGTAVKTGNHEFIVEALD